MKQRDRFIQLHKELWSNFYYDLGADMKFLDVELERIWQGFQLGEASGIEMAADLCEEIHPPKSCTQVERSLWDVATMEAADEIRSLMAQGEI